MWTQKPQALRRGQRLFGTLPPTVRKDLELLRLTPCRSLGALDVPGVGRGGRVGGSHQRIARTTFQPHREPSISCPRTELVLNPHCY